MKQYIPKIFTPVPTPVPKHILKLGTMPLPYDRTDDYSQLTFDIINGLKYIFQTVHDIVIFNASATGAMEATVANFLDMQDKTLIINGGLFGKRWAELCCTFSVAYDEIILPSGMDIDVNQIEKKLLSNNYSAVLINGHETSSGTLFDLQKIGKIFRNRPELLIVDAASMICSDTFKMDAWNIDIAITSSQKGIALPPGLAFLAFNDKAKNKLKKTNPRSYYFNINTYLRDAMHGQIPFSSAITLFIMLHQRLKDIQEIKISKVIEKQEKLAHYLRNKINQSPLPFKMLPQRPANAISSYLTINDFNAKDFIHVLQQNYNIFLPLELGTLSNRLIRISHMGERTFEDYNYLVNAMIDVFHTLKK